MDIIIFGAGNYGKKLLETINKYEGINVLGYADSVKKGDFLGLPILDVFQHEGEYCNTPVVIAVAAFKSRRTIIRRLRETGFKKIYFYLCKDFCHKQDFFEAECCYIEDDPEPILYYAEMSVIDYCNLNCKGCNHYSPIFDRTLPSREKRMADIIQLKKLYNRIVEFGLIGGEPFLNPELKDYLVETRNLLPNTEIQLVTNGLLIPQLPKELLRVMHDLSITISISPYVPTQKILEKIKDTLKASAVDYVIKPMIQKEMFYKTLSTKNDSIYPKKCISDGCVNLCDGKVARCPSLLYIPFLNLKYDIDFPEEGIYLLSDYEDGKKLEEDLEKNIPLCNHCIDFRFEWERCDKKVKLEDFVVFD